MGQEKSNKEIESIYQEKLANLQQTVETVVKENMTIKSTYSHIAKLHDELNNILRFI